MQGWARYSELYLEDTCILREKKISKILKIHLYKILNFFKIQYTNTRYV